MVSCVNSAGAVAPRAGWYGAQSVVSSRPREKVEEGEGSLGPSQMLVSEIT